MTRQRSRVEVGVGQGRLRWTQRFRGRRSLLLLAIATVIFGAVIAASHYHFNRTVLMTAMHRFAEVVQQETDRRGDLPDLQRWIAGEWQGRIRPVADEAVRQYAARTGREIIVAVGSVGQPWLQRGRPVLLYAHGRLEVAWLSVDALAQRIHEQEQLATTKRVSTLTPSDSSGVAWRP